MPQRAQGNQRTVLEALDAFDEGLTARQSEEVSGLSTGTFFRVISDLTKLKYAIKEVIGHEHTAYSITSTGQEALR